MNIRDYLDVGATFGGALLALGLVLLLAPYFPGMDLGSIKIPQFSQDVRMRLKWIGPLAPILAVAFHVPFP